MLNFFALFFFLRVSNHFWWLRSPTFRVFPSPAASLKSLICPSCCHLPESSNDTAVIYSRSFSSQHFCPAPLIYSCPSSSTFPPSPLSIIPIGCPIGCSPDPAEKALLLWKSRIFGDKHIRTITVAFQPLLSGLGKEGGGEHGPLQRRSTITCWRAASLASLLLLGGLLSSGSHQRGRLQAAFLHLTQLRLPRGAISPSQSLQVKGQEFPARGGFGFFLIIILFYKKFLSVCVCVVCCSYTETKEEDMSKRGRAAGLGLTRSSLEPSPAPSLCSLGSKPGPAKPSPRSHSGQCFLRCTPKGNTAAACQEQSRSLGRG